MTSQEAQMLNDLVRKINGTQLQEKDDDAERLLADGLGRNPDAMYMLAQTVLVQNIALDQARQQLAQLQQQNAPHPSKATSFLGSLLGHREPQPQPQQSFQSGQQYSQVPPQYTQAPQYAQPPQYAAAPAGQPSFLRSAATTAAGVAAGALAFEGVESLLHGGMGGHESFGGGGFGGGFGGGEYGAPREEIINNYYGSDGPNEQPQGGADFSGPDEQPQGGFDDSSYDTSTDNSDFGNDEDSFV